MIRLENVSYIYPGSGTSALHNISVTVNKGEFLTVLGHNGSGKSTFAKLLNGIILPTDGQVYVENMDTKNEMHLMDIRRKVGMVFQNPDNQIVATIVEEDVAFGPENLGIPPQEIRERVDWALKKVGMYAYRKHAPHLLSGGQKQRVSIAGIIAMRPDYIVLDEPTAMLDPVGRNEVMETVRALNREDGITVVLITHFMQEAAQSDRVIIINEGQMLADGKPQEILTNEEVLNKARLNLPQTTELLKKLKKSGMQTETDFISVDDCISSVVAALGKG